MQTNSIWFAFARESSVVDLTIDDCMAEVVDLTVDDDDLMHSVGSLMDKV